MWTYSGDPSKSLKDAVRFRVGDTDSQEQLLLDGEINYLLSLTNENVLAAAIQACETISAKFSRLADEAVGQVKISYNQKAIAYRKLKDDLRARIAIEDMTPYAGGISVADKEVRRDNTDRVKPDFSKHLMEPSQLAPNTEREIDNNDD